MADVCPTCGRPYYLSYERTLDLLKHGEPHRELYRAQDGKWYVTYGGGRVDEEIVSRLLQNGIIQSVYTNCPNDAYHIGRTIDVEATIMVRRQRSNPKTVIYA